MNLNQELLQLLSIDSVTGDEAAISTYVERELDALPFEMTRLGESLIFRSKPDSAKKTISFYGHLDTVQNQQDQAPHEADGKIYGCGASDMKSGLAVMMQLMRQYEAERCRFNLIFVFYDKEEGPYLENGLGPVLDQVEFLKESDLALVLEPTNNVIQAGCMGGLHASVTFLGKSSHSARPWQGENALHKAWPLLKRLSEMEPKEYVSGGLSFYEVLHATQARTFGSRNSIPGSFELNLNYRFAPGKSMEEAKAELVEIVGPGPEVKFVDECPSAMAVEKNPLLDEMIGRFSLKIEPKQAWTDIARLGLYGISAVNFGPGQSAEAHQKNESVDQQMLAQSLEMLNQFLYQ